MTACLEQPQTENAPQMQGPAYYAIIPSYVRYSRDLEPSAKLLYGEITALSNQYGYCWATNRHFAELYEVDPRTVQRWLESLKEHGFIEIELLKNGIQWQRKIWISQDIKKMFTMRQESRSTTTKMSASCDKNVVHNNTLNTTYKQQQEPSAPSASPIAAVSSERKQKEYAKPFEKKKITPMPESLAKLSIPESDKEWICTHFDTPSIEHGVAWATHPRTIIKQSLPQALKWACRTLPEIPTHPEDKIAKNKALAQKVIDSAIIPSTCNADVLNEYVLFYFPASSHAGTAINYADSKFKELLLETCKKYKFTSKQKKAA